jgi:hypothetical protein
LSGFGAVPDSGGLVFQSDKSPEEVRFSSGDVQLAGTLLFCRANLERIWQCDSFTDPARNRATRPGRNGLPKSESRRSLTTNAAWANRPATFEESRFRIWWKTAWLKLLSSKPGAILIPGKSVSGG